VMLIGIGFAVALIVAVAALRVARTHGRQHGDRILRDHVRRTY
jgi:hypothetical protein